MLSENREYLQGSVSSDGSDSDIATPPNPEKRKFSKFNERNNFDIFKYSEGLEEDRIQSIHSSLIDIRVCLRRHKAVRRNYIIGLAQNCVEVITSVCRFEKKKNKKIVVRVLRLVCEVRSKAFRISRRRVLDQ